MFPDWPSFAFGAGIGLTVGAAAVLYLLRDALAAYRHSQEYKQAQRVAGIVHDILKVRMAPDGDDPNPLKTHDVAEAAFWQAVKEAEQAALKVEMAKHMLNYKGNEK